MYAPGKTMRYGELPSTQIDLKLIFISLKSCCDVLSFKNIIISDNIVEIIKSNDIEKLKKLLSIHPNIVHMRDEYKHTPLMRTVCFTDNTSMVEILISYGSDVWAEDSVKQNSYHFAAYRDRHTILDMLCRHDVTNINRGDVNNFTPLHLAAMFGNISCVDVLLRHENIDVTIKDKYGNTAYDDAGDEHNREIIRRKIKEYETTFIVLCVIKTSEIYIRFNYYDYYFALLLLVVCLILILKSILLLESISLFSIYFIQPFKTKFRRLNFIEFVALDRLFLYGL
ncbi:putative ankyrin repeat protein RBE_0319 [Hydractinia symbiolongicarpus]|uniref:putative ankyrin repeat protein RBE_0319 n=1 Tax=Hydractinia symbiolongicarpus TaxID=13093 RepID=UPI00254AE493|nr:putative ankyrin repeat protein RBE_0319 [Hydractinia symbiolongicarpus]